MPNQKPVVRLQRRGEEWVLEQVPGECYQRPGAWNPWVSLQRPSVLTLLVRSACICMSGTQAVVSCDLRLCHLPAEPVLASPMFFVVLMSSS